VSQDRETNLALFLDFDNVALGARDARQRFDIKFLLQRILEKGKIIVKRAYADWRYYKEHMGPLHEAAIELIEIPMPRISGKNSADIRLVVDAMDLCYSKHHIDTFVIVSGDSDFSPLVSKLRENNKRVIGIGVKNSSSHLLISNCDEFIFYDDIYRDAVGQAGQNVANVPSDKRELFDFLVKTAGALLQESRGVLYSSLIKDTMTRKQPDFNERSYGYSNFGDLLDDARRLGLLVVERDARAGGTWVVQGLGQGQDKGAVQVTGQEQGKEAEAAPPAEGNGKSRSSRRRRGRGGRKRESDEARQDAAGEAAAAGSTPPAEKPAAGDGAQAKEKAAADKPAEKRGSPRRSANRRASTGRSASGATAEPAAAEAQAKKTPTKKTTTKKTTTKKTVAKKAPTKKTPAKKTTKKTAAKKTTTKKTAAKKAPARKTAAKKTTTKKTSSRAPRKKASSGKSEG
jgi:uncharacterized protein (TIGR00288 family)